MGLAFSIAKKVSTPIAIGNPEGTEEWRRMQERSRTLQQPRRIGHGR